MEASARNPLSLLDGEWFYGKNGENRYTIRDGEFTQYIKETGETVKCDLQQHIDGWCWGDLETQGTFALKVRGKCYIESKFKPYGITFCVFVIFAKHIFFCGSSDCDSLRDPI